MPLVIGFHPWYQIPEAPRDQWKVRLPVREHYVLSPKVIPTGETKPMDLPDPIPLAGRHLDDVFGGVDSNSEFSLEAQGRKVSVQFGPKFPIAIVYAPETSRRSVLRAHDRPHRRLQPGARGALQRLAERSARRNLDGKFLDYA